jgi:2-polyprenyl-3-methyl-5-hydroxy-6-metoxy-1,4-benzoquinol methylase
MKQRPISHLKAWNKEHLRGIWKGPYSLDFFDRYVTPPARILDAGCGVGRYTIPLAMREYEVTGVDISRIAITELDNARLRRNMEMGLAAADVCHLPFRDNTFDAVAAFGVLQHLLEEGKKCGAARVRTCAGAWRHLSNRSTWQGGYAHGRQGSGTSHVFA